MAERVVNFEVGPGHPVLAGHFPGRPIVPGVMLLEWVLVEVARMTARATAALRLREAKFFAPLEPAQGAELRLDRAASRAIFEIRSDTRLIARGVVEWDGD